MRDANSFIYLKTFCFRTYFRVPMSIPYFVNCKLNEICIIWLSFLRSFVSHCKIVVWQVIFNVSDVRVELSLLKRATDRL